MTPGRPRLSDEEKRAKGTLQKSRERTPLQPAILAQVPDPPPMLGEDAQRVWLVNAQFLFDRGQLSATDLNALAIYCNAVEEVWYFDRLLKENGYIKYFKDEDGVVKYTQPADEVSLRREAIKLTQQYEREFGFTPVARLRLGAKKDDKPKNPFADL